MAKFLVQADFSAQGVASVMAEGGLTREIAVGRAFKLAGVNLDSLHFSWGGAGIVLIVDAPSLETLCNAMTVLSPGDLISINTHHLLSSAEFDIDAGEMPVM